jgi:MoxR-like ATPase
MEGKRAHAAAIFLLDRRSFSGRDMCVLGGKGAGKSLLVRQFARRLGYAVEVFPLFKDMTARDLLQRRATDQQGSTVWEVRAHGGPATTHQTPQTSWCCGSAMSV